MDAQQNKSIAKAIQIGLIAGLLAVVVFIGIGIMTPHDARGDLQPGQVVTHEVPAVAAPALTAETEQQPPLDAGARLACRAWAPIAKDANDGLLSQTEFRDGVKGVYEHAKAWPHSDVSRTSRSLLAALTTGLSGVSQQEADQALRDRFLALARACDKWESHKPE